MARGFYWSSNSPYIRGQWLRLRRAPRAPALSTTVDDGFIDITVNGRVMRNANPAYMVYEILTNPEWGMGGSPAQIDVDNFRACAQLFRDENFGLFMIWVQSDTIENFLSEVLDHVQAFLFLSPLTGLWTLRPLRADYDVDSLPSYGPDNADISDFDHKLPGETINEIIVTWTNPVTEKPETVGAQDLANIVQQGGQIVSQTRNYYGVREATKAAELAARDLRTACAPLARCTIKAFRKAWSTSPGDCVKVTAPDEEAFDLVMRVQDVDYGDGSDKYVTVTVLEDIFALDSPVYTGAPSTGWVTTRTDPTPPDFVKLFTVPAFIVATSADDYVVQPADPEVNAGILVADANDDFLNVEPYTAVTLANGTIAQQSIGTRDRVGYGVTASALAAEATTVFASFPSTVGSGPRLAGLVFIGGGGDTATEIALVQAVDSSGAITLARGVLDTVPRDWPVGTPMWFLNTQTVIDPTPRVAGETVAYRPLMRTSVGLLPFDSAEAWTITLNDRPYLPLRPANVQVNGTGFGTATIGTADAIVTWSNRNRLTETSQVLSWTAGSVTPETGQTTTIRVLDAAGAVLQTFAGLTGTTYTVPAAMLVGAKAIRVSAVAPEGESLQSYTLTVA